MVSDIITPKRRKIPGNTGQTIPVLGMTCASCAISVERMLKTVPGVKNASVNFANQSAYVEYDQTTVKPLDLQHAVRSIGYDLVVDVADPDKVKEENQKKNYKEIKLRTVGASVLALPVLIIGMFFMDMPYAHFLSMVLTAPVVFYFGRGFFTNAWKQARHRKANMDTLVALSTGVAFLFSFFNSFFPEFWESRGVHAHVYYETAAVVIAFISLGKWLEEKAKSKTSFAIRKLMGLQPKTVKVILNGFEQELPVTAVKPGHVIIIKPGERVPVDGVIINGSSFVDECMITGEPVPVEKNTGHQVFAGTVNQKGSFQFKVQKVGGDTILGRIIKMVQEAQGSKAPVQKLVDKIAGIFVPVVIAIAIFTFMIWMILGEDNAFAHALLTSVTVLIVACPCALGLATPTAIMVGIGRGAENNILIKDAESLELAHQVNALILDKTGTITEGKPLVTDLIWEKGDTNNSLPKQILYSLEVQSEHPLAEAIVRKLKDEGVTPIVLEEFSSLTGLGVKALFQQNIYYVGNERLIEENDIRISSHIADLFQRLKEEAKTVVFFADQKDVLAVIAIADKIKPTSVTAIKSLQKRGIAIYMLTGDNEQNAKVVAQLVGINHYQSAVLPSDKASFIKKLQDNGKIVAMVGDGINDAQALAQADVSIAMGKGSDIAIDAAKMTLITSDLQYVTKALNLSGKTIRGIRQNLFWAFIYNLIGIPLAMGILYPINGFLLDPMIAGAAMALSSVSVVGNSLRLRTVRID